MHSDRGSANEAAPRGQGLPLSAAVWGDATITGTGIAASARYFHKAVHSTLDEVNHPSFSPDHSGSPDHGKILIAANTKAVLCKQ